MQDSGDLAVSQGANLLRAQINVGEWPPVWASVTNFRTRGLTGINTMNRRGWEKGWPQCTSPVDALTCAGSLNCLLSVDKRMVDELALLQTLNRLRQ